MVTRVIEETHNGHDMVTGGSEEICNGHDLVTGVIEETDNGPDMVIGATEQIRNRHDMVTGVIEETQNRHDMVTGIQEEIPYCLLDFCQENKRRSAPQIIRNFEVGTTLRQLKQTKFCWPFNNWQLTTILPMSITTKTESRKCLNHSQRKCPHLIKNQRNLNSLKICPKQA